MLKMLFLCIRIFLEVFGGFLFLYFTISIYGNTIPIGELREDGEIYIYVQSNGIHTDICMPTNTDEINWIEFLSLDPYIEDCPHDFVSIGWGDKGFFLNTPTWGELKVSTAFNAVFLPSPTAMHVAYSSEPEVNENRKCVTISREDYKKLIIYIKKSFKKVENQVDLIEGKGYTGSDNFYEAHKSYHLFRTCNIWTNEGLKAANVRTGIYALFPDGILSHL